MLKKLLFACACTALAVRAAQAADVVEQPVFDWTGFYLGAHVGYGDPSFDGKFDSNEEDNEDISFADKIDADGILAGFQGGYNWQMDSLVLGIEADFSITDFSGDTEDKTKANGDGIDAQVDFLTSLRARAGFAADNLLFYATGGVAYEESKFDFTDNFADAGSIHLDSFGYVVGGGAEWAFADNASVRIEGLYYGFNDENKDLSSISDGDTTDSIEFQDVWVIRGGFNVLFR